MKKLLLADGSLNYAVATGTTASSATTPDTLVPGSVGVYGIDPTDAQSSIYKSVLINAANDDKAFSEFVVALGTAQGGPVVSQPIVIANATPNGIATSAADQHVVVVGYNGTSGSLNLPTIADRDWGEVKLVKTTFGINQEVDKDVFEASALSAGDADYEVAVKLVNAAASKDANTIFVENRVLILDDLGAGTDYSQTVGVTNGSTAITVASTGHTTTVGDYVRILGDLYKIAGVTDVNNYTLDRPYTGATNSAVAAASVKDLGNTDPTAVGLQFTAKTADVIFDGAVQGVLENATITTTTQGTIGVGTPLYMAELVRQNKAYFGYFDQIDRRRPAPETGFDSSVTYDLYKFDVQPVFPARNEMNATFTTKYDVTVGFGGTGGDSQATFQTVINTIFGTSISI